MVDFFFVDFVFFNNLGVEVVECLVKVVCKFYYYYGFECYCIIIFEGVFYGCFFVMIVVGK